MDFSTRLKELRLKRGLTQQELADRLNVTKSAISYWEVGARMPSVEGMQSIANFFGVTVDFMTGRQDDVEYYTDPQAAKIAQEMFDRPELRVLFDAAADASKEDILQIAQLLEKLKK